jgi:2-polyprenyl-6-hydroxyphenyl methylase/3-demethylubiquinone-9 3-methyltransferase
METDMASGARASTVDPAEVRRFDAMSADWWNPDGVMKPLHAMNPVRLGFIRAQIDSHFGVDPGSAAPLAGRRVVDVGCGGGLLSEPMARLGAQVVGLDPAAGNITVAVAHAETMGLSIDYRAETIEAVAARGERFDLVLALEVVEHVADVPAFIRALTLAAKPGGLVILSTLNRTLRSFGAAIIGAEYVLRWLPVGTHDWEKFVTPDELDRHLRAAGLNPLDRAGMVPDLMRGGWRLSSDTAVNYIVSARRGE